MRKITLLEKLLIEGRKQDAIKKYPWAHSKQYLAFREGMVRGDNSVIPDYLKKSLEQQLRFAYDEEEEQKILNFWKDDGRGGRPLLTPLEFFTQPEVDPSGNNKYLMWYLKNYQAMVMSAAYGLEDATPEKFANYQKGDPVSDFKLEYQLARTTGLSGRFAVPIDRDDRKNLKNFPDYDTVSSEEGISPNSLVVMVRKFHEALKRKIIPPKYRDITSIKNYKEMYELVNRLNVDLLAIDDKKALKAAAKTGAEKIDLPPEIKDISLLRIKTKQASCLFGKGTKWCIAADKENLFKNYTEGGSIFYFIFNPEHPDRNYKKIALQYSTKKGLNYNDPTFIFNAADEQIDKNVFFDSLRQVGIEDEKINVLMSKIENNLRADPNPPKTHSFTESKIERQLDKIFNSYDKWAKIIK